MHIISIADLSVDDIGGILDLAEDLKKKRKDGVVTDYLKNKSLVMIFEKSSNYLLEQSLPNILSGNYGGEHWLASFAVYALSQ